MKRTLVFTILFLTAMFFALACSESTSGGDGKPPSHGDPDADQDFEWELPTVSFQSDAWSVSYADDTDAVTAGVQVDIAITTVNAPDGSTATLTVNDVALETTADISGNAATFEDVGVMPGANSLAVVVDIEALDAADDPTATATVTLGGCRLTFVSPTGGTALSDEGGDCDATCGDDLDCAAPNLQYNISLATENVGGGSTASITVDALAPNEATVGAGTVEFAMVSLPHGDSLTLLAEATSTDSQTCQAEITIAVTVQCNCRITVLPVPKDYNLEDTDDDTETDGFQKTYIASSNCLDGSLVSFILDGSVTRDAVPLSDGQAEKTITLGDGDRTLNISIVEDGSGRIGETGEYAFNVDRTAPTLTIDPPIVSVMDVNTDKNANLDDGIQFDAAGTTTDIADFDPPAAVALDITSGETAIGDTYYATISGGAFAFSSISLTQPDGVADPVPFDLTFAIVDEHGNEVTEVVGIEAYFSPATVTITDIAGEDATTSPLALNVAVDEDGATDELQATVTAVTTRINIGSTARLKIYDVIDNNGTPELSLIETLIGSVVYDSVNERNIATWSMELDYGAYALVASADIAAGLAEANSSQVDIWADWVAPSPEFVSPLEGAWVTQRTITVEVAAGHAEEDQEATLTVSGTDYNADLDAQGHATFENVNLPDGTRAEDYTLSFSVADIAGNTGSAEITIHYDGEEPTVEVVLDPSVVVNLDGEITDQNDIEVDVTVTDDVAPAGRNVDLELFNMDDPENPVSQGIQTLTLSPTPDRADVSAFASYTWAILSDGSWRAVAAYADPAMNDGSGSLDFIVNTDCYTFGITSPLNGHTFGPDDDANTGMADFQVQVGMNSLGDDAAPDGTEFELLIINPENVSDVVIHNPGGTAISGGVMTIEDVTLPLNVSRKLKVRTNIGTIIDPDYCYSSEVVVKVDTLPPTLSLTSPSPADPIVFNAQSPDASPSGGFQAEFTYHSDDAETGDTATLIVSDGITRRSDQYSADLDASGDAVFSQTNGNAITLVGTDYFPEGTPLTLTATLEDVAGNVSEPLVNNVNVDRTLPSFRDYDPSPGILNSTNDASGGVEGFQFGVELYIDGGTPGAGVVEAEIIWVPPEGYEGEDPVPIDLGTYSLAGNGKVGIKPCNKPPDYNNTPGCTLEEGVYDLTVSHTDTAGNGNDDTVRYTLDFVAGLELLEDFTGYQDIPRLDEQDNVIIDPETGEPIKLNWGLSYDRQQATPGFFPRLMANAYGFADGAQVRLCSNVGRHDSTTPNGTCTADGNFIVVEIQSVTLPPGSPNGTVTFGFEALVNNTEHKIFIEAEDSAENFVSTIPTTVYMDSEKPSVSGIAIASNSTSNDDAANNTLWLGLAEGAPDDPETPTELAVDVSVSTGSADAAQAKLYLGDETAQLIDTVDVVSGVATFLGVVIPNGNLQPLTAVVLDEVDNASPPFAQSVLADLIAPTVAFNGGGATIDVYSAACNSIVGEYCFTNILIDVGSPANDPFNPHGSAATRYGVITLRDSASRSDIASTEIPSLSAGASTTVTFENVSLPQEVLTLYVTATDQFLNSADDDNEFNVDSLAPAASFTTPTDPKSYTGADDSGGEGACSAYGSQSDQYLTRCDWDVSFSGVSMQTTVELQYRYNAGDRAEWGVWRDFPFAAETSTTLMGTETNWQPARIDFGYEGDYQVKVLVVEVDTGNTWETAEADYLDIDVSSFTPTYIFEFQRSDSSSFTSGEVFDENDEQDGDNDNATVQINFKVDTMGTIATGTMALNVNGSSNDALGNPISSQTITDSVATFNGIAVNENAENILYVEVVALDDANSSVTIVADTKAPQLSFTSPTFETSYNATTGANVGNVIVKSSDIMDYGASATLVAEDGTRANLFITPPAGTWTEISEEGYKSQVTFSNVTLPNGSFTLEVEDSLGGVPADVAGHAGVIDNSPTISVDTEIPGSVEESSLSVCIAEDTGADDTDRQQEPALCGTETYGCNGDENRCERRRGKTTLFWTAPTDNIGVSDYEIHVVKKENVDFAACSAETGDCPCTGVTWTSENDPDDVVVTLDALSGGTHSAVVTGLDVTNITSYCFLIKSKDAVGNISAAEAKTGREINIITAKLGEDLGNAGSRRFGAYAVWGNFNGDDTDDVVTADWKGGNDEGYGYAGEIYLYYGTTDMPSSVAAPDWTTRGPDGSRLGNSLSAGDVNGDGYDDLVLGAPYASVDKNGNDVIDTSPDSDKEDNKQGKVFVYLGGAGGLTTSAGGFNEPTYAPDVTIDGIDKDLDETAGYNWRGQQFGKHVEVLNFNGDSNGDNKLYDIAASTYKAPYENSTYIIYGRSSWNAEYTAASYTGDNVGDANIAINKRSDSTHEPPDGPRFGWFLSHTDIDGDGYDDLLLSDVDHHTLADEKDCAWVFWGTDAHAGVSDHVAMAATDGVDFFEIENPTTDGSFGQYVFGSPDTGNDGYGEVLVNECFEWRYYNYTVGSSPKSLTYDSTNTSSYNPDNTEELVTAGDLNFDDYTDIVESGIDTEGNGVIRIYWGQDGGAHLAGNCESSGDCYVLTGLPQAEIQAGGGGDFNGDGNGDLMMLDKDNGDFYTMY